MTFQDRLSTALAGASVSPRELARELGVSVQAIGQVLSGETRALTAANCARAARFLAVDTLWLATGEGEMRPAQQTPTMALSSEEKDLIVALRVLPEEDRRRFLSEVMNQARAQLQHLEALLGRHPGPGAEVVPIKRL